METRLNRFKTSRALGLISLLALGVVSARAAGSSLLVDHVRAANDRFKDVAVAVAEGYSPIACASGLQGGAMGIHYVSGERLKDGVIDLAKPEAVMYEPMPDGTMNLVAVEYIAFKGPAALEGQLFNIVTEPNRYGLDKFYELHVWAWKQNPAGNFADNNPNVSCDAAKPAN